MKAIVLVIVWTFMTSAVGGDATCGDGEVDGDGVPTMACVARVSVCCH